MREVIRHVQAARKAADLKVDDRIELSLHTDGKELNEAMHVLVDTIKNETLATNVYFSVKGFSFSQDASVEGEKLHVELQLAG